VMSRLTFEPSFEWAPTWSPDGTRIAYGSNSGDVGGTRIYVKTASGIGTRAEVPGDNEGAVPITWLRRGDQILFARQKPNGPGFDTWAQQLAGGNATKVLDMPFDKLHVAPSPDGQWVAYATNESGQYQVFVQTFPDGSGGRWQITSDGGVEPRWRRDGRELYFLGLDGKLMAVPVSAGAAFTAGRPQELFQTLLTVNRGSPGRDTRYDVAPDGRFLIVAPVAAPAQTPFTIVVNWPSTLKK
jgi:eukaryotic-like serine/threonine-protein kinase